MCDSCFEQFGPKEEEGGSPVHEKVKSNVDPGRLRNLQLNVIFQVKAEKEGAESLPAEYLASPLSKQPQEPQPKQVENYINDYSHFRLDI